MERREEGGGWLREKIVEMEKKKETLCLLLIPTCKSAGEQIVTATKSRIYEGDIDLLR